MINTPMTSQKGREEQKPGSKDRVVVGRDEGPVSADRTLRAVAPHQLRYSLAVKFIKTIGSSSCLEVNDRTKVEGHAAWCFCLPISYALRAL